MKTTAITSILGDSPRFLNDAECNALERLIDIAQGYSGQCKYVANFLLAWWNATTCGGFDLTDAWNVDPKIQADMLTLFPAIVRLYGKYPDQLGYKPDFLKIIARWHPELLEDSDEEELAN